MWREDITEGNSNVQSRLDECNVTYHDAIKCGITPIMGLQTRRHRGGLTATATHCLAVSPCRSHSFLAADKKADPGIKFTYTAMHGARPRGPTAWDLVTSVWQRGQPLAPLCGSGVNSWHSLCHSAVNGSSRRPLVQVLDGGSASGPLLRLGSNHLSLWHSRCNRTRTFRP